MPTYKTPDVYVEEISVFPPSVAEVETAVPAFIGYTQFTKDQSGNDLTMVPMKIYSRPEFETLFGFWNSDAIQVAATSVKDSNNNVTSYKLAVTEISPSFLLYFSIRMFFENGGGPCYIVSTGDYTKKIATDGAKDFESALDAVAKEDEPTMLVIPDAVKLDYAGFMTVTQAMLAQCGKLRDRFAILDVWSGDQAIDFQVAVPPDNTKEGLITANRSAWVDNLTYGAAYYPFVTTTMDYLNYLFDESVDINNKITSNVTVAVDGAGAADLSSFKASNTALYNAVKAELLNHFINLPPSGAVAGIYAQVDNSRGVWKAPANVGVQDVLEPMVKLDNDRQDGLNVDPPTGKSINALRAFTGKGTLVWGARTLAGNDNEWRYISVRRFFIMVEESVKDSTYWAVFEPNDANTWVKVRGMIENYLTQKWREGALAGATTKDAFYVKCGLGTTMTADDILNGTMNVEIGMAVVRPAEFIVLKFSHKLQTS